MLLLGLRRNRHVFNRNAVVTSSPGLPPRLPWEKSFE